MFKRINVIICIYKKNFSAGFELIKILSYLFFILMYLSIVSLFYEIERVCIWSDIFDDTYQIKR